MPKILFLAPAGAVKDLSALDRAAHYFSQHGWQVQASDNVSLHEQRFAGDDATRLKELHAAADSDADVVMAVRGGYGLTRLLSKINWKKIARAEKIWIGHSDFTAFNLALWAHTKSPSYAGPMVAYDFGGANISAFTEKHFWNFLKQSHISLKVRAAAQPQISAEGVLWGGNLSVLNSLIGTPHFPQVNKGILFLEDVNEHPYRLERMLYQLHDAGVLKRQRALLLGDFSAYRLSPFDKDYSFETMLAHIREKFSLPIFTHLPFGHCAHKLTLPVGGYAQVTGVRGGYQLTLRR